MKVYIILLFTFIFFYEFAAIAQTDVERNNGITLSGSLHDSTRNITLEAAAVALYKQGDDKIHSIALSSRTGRFVIENLPPQTSFQFRVSSMGYDPLECEIFIRDSSINLGALYLLPRTNELEVVEVLSPVKLNGDTIEFNADAFHLDSNAVAGDLLAKLPGITIWGDNEITYNGKKINKLYVNGTDFFSTNSNIALQNIPKNIIEKVQIFDTERERRETKDANIVLKKGKDRGVFGKIGAGLGTNRQRELEAVTSLFNSSSQLAVGGSKGNINKPLNNVDQLLNNTTFGGVNLGLDYFSDLRKRGYHEDSAYGLLFKHDFRNNTLGMTADKNELKVDLFQKSSNSLSERNSNILWLTSDESDNSTVTEENLTSEVNNFLGNVSYNLKKDNRTDLDIEAKFERRKVDNNRNTSTTSQIYGIQTRENSQSLEELDQRILNLNTALRIFGRSRFDRMKWYDNIYLKYNLLINPSTSVLQTEKDIESTNTEFENRAFLRNSQVKRNRVDHDAFSKFERIFPHKLRGIADIDIAQRVRLIHNNSDNIVRDSLKINESLTYNEEDFQFSSTSSLSLGRKFIIDELYMRYEKSFGVYSNFDLQINKDDVRSGYSDRNLNRTNTFIMPSIRLNYLNKIDQNFVKDLNLSWNISYDIPSIELIAPVVDNINILNQTYGNPDLKKSKDNNISLRYIFTNLKPTGLNYDLAFNVKLSENAFTQSIAYKSDGRRDLYFVNDQNIQVSYISSINLRKAFKLSPKTNFTAKFSNMGILSKKGQVINENYDRLEGMSYNGKLDLMFNFSDLVKLGVYQQFDYFQKKNQLNTNFKNTTSDSNLSLGLGVRKRAFLNTSVSYRNVENINNSDGVFLWNVSASYRALRKSNLEIKLSVLDILNNNSSMNARSTSAYTIYETNNIIRRYLMLNLSYYPRFF
ncbi:MAG: TonB-dependent receptor [Sphingobacterium sp.]